LAEGNPPQSQTLYWRTGKPGRERDTESNAPEPGRPITMGKVTQSKCSSRRGGCQCQRAEEEVQKRGRKKSIQLYRTVTEKVTLGRAVETRSEQRTFSDAGLPTQKNDGRPRCNFGGKSTTYKGSTQPCSIAFGRNVHSPLGFFFNRSVGTLAKNQDDLGGTKNITSRSK